MLNNPENRFKLELDYGIGFTEVIFHTIRFGHMGTVSNYVADGGQDVLFPYQRYTTWLSIGKHTVYFLYQPFTVQSKVQLKNNLILDGVTFPTGSGILLNYGFPFYRVSYTYDVLRKGNSYLALGLSLHLRNADSYFESLDGTKFVDNKNAGPVPIIKVKDAYWLNEKTYLAADIDGFYASSKFIDGADFDFKESVLHASLRAGLLLTDYLETYFNLRFMGEPPRALPKTPTGPTASPTTDLRSSISARTSS